MSEKLQTVDEAALRSTLAEIVLETPGEELSEALGQAGLENDAERSRAVIQKALQESDVEPLEAGGAPELRQGLGAMLAMLMRREGLSDDELADRAGVEVDELRRIRLDPEYVPSPRTIYRLECFFELPSRGIAILTGAVRVADDASFRRDVHRFAAQSASIGKLTREERRLLNEFVSLLDDATARS